MDTSTDALIAESEAVRADLDRTVADIETLTAVLLEEIAKFRD